MVRIAGERLEEASGFVRAEARHGPVEITYDGRPELVVLTVEDYALLRQNRKLAFALPDMPVETIRRIANSKMDAEHPHLEALMDH
jgi:prevent-host-death family protein